MNYLDWIRQVDQNQVRGAYLVLVSEPFLWDSMKKILQDQVLVGSYLDFNFQIFDFPSMSPEEFTGALETLPFFQKKKVVIGEHLPLDKGQVKEYEEKLLDLARYLKKANASTLLFLQFDGALPFKGKAYHALEPYLQIIRLSRLTKTELQNFILKRFKARGLRVEKPLVPFLAEKSSYFTHPQETSLYQIANMVDSVAGLAEDGKVTLKDGQALFKDPAEENIFKLMDAISARDAVQAVSLMVGFTQIQEDPVRIFYMTVRQIRNLIGVKLLKSRRISPSEAIKILGLSSFEYHKLESAVDRFHLEELFSLHEKLFQMETNLKTRPFDMTLGMEAFYGRLGPPKNKGN